MGRQATAEVFLAMISHDVESMFCRNPYFSTSQFLELGECESVFFSKGHLKGHSEGYVLFSMVTNALKGHTELFQ